MRTSGITGSVARLLLVAALVAPTMAPAFAFGEEPDIEPSLETSAPASSDSSETVALSDESSASALATVVAGDADPTGTWTGLKGHTSAVRIVGFERGVAQGKNLIVIQVEALQAGLINKRVNGREITPNLNDIVNATGTWYFPNCYSQIARGNTSDAEFVMNSSLYPPINDRSAVKWGDKRVPSLARQFRKAGYTTATFHANSADFWNRRNLYAALGFNRYYDRSFFGTTDFWKWGTNDKIFFSKSMSVLKSWKAAKKPFYAQFITLSSHRPFTFPEMSRRPWKPTGVYAGTNTGNYLSAQSYADAAIGQFVRDLKSAGLWDKSVVVIYGDHYGQDNPDTSRERAAQKAFYGRSIRVADRLRVPLIMHVPGTTGGRINDAVGQIDIAPTVADAMGLNMSGMRCFGRDAFTDTRPVVGFRGVVPNGSYIDNRILATPWSFRGGPAHDLKTWQHVRVTPLDKRVYVDIKHTMAGSLRYTNNLPKRPGATRLRSGAIIPNL